MSWDVLNVALCNKKNTNIYIYFKKCKPLLEVHACHPSTGGWSQEDDLRPGRHSKTLFQKKQKKELGNETRGFVGKQGPAGLAVGVNCRAGEGAHFARTAVWLLPAELHVPARPLTLRNFHSESPFHTAVISVCDLNEHRDRGPLTHL